MAKKAAVRTKHTLWPVWLGASIVCVVSLLLLLSLAASAMCRTDLSQSIYMPITTGLSCVSCLLGGLVLGRITGEKGTVRGALLGIGFFILLMIICFIGGGFQLSAFAAIRLLLYAVFGAIGGYIGVLRHEKKRRLH